MIYFISKKLEISAAHSLTLSYESKCSSLHGHNWQIELFFVGRELNQDGMVIDFTHVKKAVHGKMDHANLNEVFDFNPTAENIGRWLVDLFPECYRLRCRRASAILPWWLTKRKSKESSIWFLNIGAGN